MLSMVIESLTLLFGSLEANFAIQVPPIFNVCPHSTHRIFPRIDIDDALAKLAVSEKGGGSLATRDFAPIQ